MRLDTLAEVSLASHGTDGSHHWTDELAVDLECWCNGLKRGHLKPSERQIPKDHSLEKTIARAIGVADQTE